MKYLRNIYWYVSNKRTEKWKLYKKGGIDTEKLIDFLKKLLGNKKIN